MHISKTIHCTALIAQRSWPSVYLSVICVLMSFRHFPVLGTNALCQRAACRHQTTWALPAVQTLQGKTRQPDGGKLEVFLVLFIWLIFIWGLSCQINSEFVLFYQTGIWRISHKIDLKTGKVETYFPSKWCVNLISINVNQKIINLNWYVHKLISVLIKFRVHFTSAKV